MTEPARKKSKVAAPSPPPKRGSARATTARRYTKTERSHEENQERAYIAASRRSDRSLEARMESARRASEIHKQRTGRGFKITEKAVMNEEMYEEEDPDYDQRVRRLMNVFNNPSYIGFQPTTMQQQSSITSPGFPGHQFPLPQQTPTYYFVHMPPGATDQGQLQSELQQSPLTSERQLSPVQTLSPTMQMHTDHSPQMLQRPQDQLHIEMPPPQFSQFQIQQLQLSPHLSMPYSQSPLPQSPMSQTPQSPYAKMPLPEDQSLFSLEFSPSTTSQVPMNESEFLTSPPTNDLLDEFLNMLDMPSQDDYNGITLD